MGVSGRLLLATAISILFLLAYDVFVIKPRVERQRNREQKAAQKHEAEHVRSSVEVTRKEDELSDAFVTKSVAFLLFEDEFQNVRISENGIERVELSEFALLPGSKERYFFDSPVRMLFVSEGKVLRLSAQVQGDTIGVHCDGLTGTISFERLSRYSFALKYDFYASSEERRIDMTPVFIIRKSVHDDSRFVAISSKVQELKDIDVRENINIVGEDSRYFAFVFFVPGGLSVHRQDVLYGQRIQGEGYASFYVKFFAGPKTPDELAMFSERARTLAGYGFFGPISELLVFSLERINVLIGNMGVSIIVLSILIRIIFFPLSAMSLKSIKKIKDIQPEIEKIKEKYKNDKERMSREIFELYRREKINPFSGCLPLLIQIPIFIALYNALMHSVDLRHAPFALWIKDLSEPDSLFTLSALGLRLDFRLLPIIMGISFLVQQLITPQTQQDQTMKILNYLMPVVFVFILWNVPSGLQIYWITTNIVGILQQIVVMRFYK